MTRLESFIRANGIKPSALTRIAGVSRQHLLRLRMGKMDPTRRVMARITMASAILLGRLVSHGEVFEIWDIGLKRTRTRPQKTRRKATRRKAKQ